MINSDLPTNKVSLQSQNQWQIKKLWNVISLEYGTGLTGSQRIYGDFPVYGSNGQVGKNGAFLVNGPGIIVGRKGSIGKVLWSSEPFWPIDTTYYVRVNGNYDLRWCYWLLLSLPLDQLDSSTGIPGLNRNDAYELLVKVPPNTEEQRRIAHILDTIDAQIQETEQLIAKLKQVKAGLLHDLLTRGIDEHGEVRDPVAHPEQFKEVFQEKITIPGEWEILQVKGVGTVQLGRQRSPLHQTGRYTTPYLRVANVFDGWIDYSDVLEMDFTPEEREIYNLVPGDILLNEGQSLKLVGRCAIYTGPLDTFCFQNTLVRFRCNARVIPEYCQAVFKYWLDRGKFALIAKQTTSVAHLGADRFTKMTFFCPTLNEQHRIIAILNAQHAHIATEEAHLNKLRQIKRGLMHDLLTGAVRVTQLTAVDAQ